MGPKLESAIREYLQHYNQDPSHSFGLLPQT